MVVCVRPTGDKPGGFTLVELLSVIGVISVLVGLILPAAMEAREAARRLGCASNLKGLALGVHLYEGTWNAVPPGATGGRLGGSMGYAGFSVHATLLPYIELSELYNTINFHSHAMFPSDLASGPNRTASRAPIGLFICPTDPNRAARSGVNSYRLNAGLCKGCDHDDGGLSRFNRGVAVGSIRDGLSNTLLFSEKLIGAPSAGEAPLADWVPLPRGPIPRTADAWVARCASLPAGLPSDRTAGHTWLLGGGVYTLFFLADTPNSPRRDCGIYSFLGQGLFTARSLHRDGVNTVMADGSMRWTARTVDPRSWRARGTRAGGEPASD